MENRIKPNSNNKLGVLNVHPYRGGFHVELWIDGKRIQKQCATLDEAILARDLIKGFPDKPKE
jgi:hypothetical protein